MQHTQSLFVTLILLATSTAGCGGGGSSAGTAGAPPVSTPPISSPVTSGTPTLDYSGPAVFTRGAAGLFIPSFRDGGGKVSISPDLPAGLTIDSSTGAVVGTPTELSPARDYQVSVIAARATTVTLTLEVTSGPLFYPSPAILQIGIPMAPLKPMGTDYLTRFSVSPALPEGLSIDALTGTISGTPTKPSPDTYYVVTGADSELYRQYGLTMRVGDTAAGTASTASFECVHSGGFVGTFATDASSPNYGLVAIAFTPDGRAHARVQDLLTNETTDSDGLEGLAGSGDGGFTINFPATANVTINGNFIASDVITGIVSEGAIAKPFVATRLGGAAGANFRYSGGFGYDNGYRVDFGTVDVTGSNLTGVGYQMNYIDTDLVLTNREVPFSTTITNGKFTVTVDHSTTTFPYAAGQATLALGDSYDELLFLETKGCALN